MAVEYAEIIDKHDDSYVWIYYNEDGNDSNGQFVEQHFDAEIAKKAVKVFEQTKDKIDAEGKFFRFFDDSIVYLIDNDDSEKFKEYAESVMSKEHDYVSTNYNSEKFTESLVEFFKKSDYQIFCDRKELYSELIEETKSKFDDASPLDKSDLLSEISRLNKLVEKTNELIEIHNPDNPIYDLSYHTKSSQVRLKNIVDDNTTINYKDIQILEFNIDNLLNFMYAKEHDVISETTGRNSYDECVLISDLMDNNLRFKEVYYDKVIMDSIAKANQIQKSDSDGYSAVKTELKNTIDKEINKIKKAIDPDNERYSFSVIDFGCSKVAVSGLVDFTDLWDNSEFKIFVVENKIELCENYELGTKIDCTIEHYIVGNGKGEVEDAPSSVIASVNRYPNLLTDEISADNTISDKLNAGYLELSCYMANYTLKCNRIKLDSGEVFYSSPDIEQVHDLPNWQSIRKRNIIKENGIDDFLTITVEKLAVTDTVSDSYANPRTTALIQAYSTDISEFITVNEKYSYYQNLFLDPDDVLIDFIEHGKKIHANSPKWTNYAFDDDFFYDKDRRCMNEIKFQDTEWMPLEKAIIFMTENKITADKIEYMNLSVIDSNGIPKKMDLNAEAVALISKNCDDNPELLQTAKENYEELTNGLDLTAKRGRK